MHIDCCFCNIEITKTDVGLRVVDELRITHPVIRKVKIWNLKLDVRSDLSETSYTLWKMDMEGMEILRCARDKENKRKFTERVQEIG